MDFGFLVTNERIDSHVEKIEVVSSIDSKETSKLFINIPNKASTAVQYKLIYLNDWKLNKVLDRDYLLFTIEGGKSVSIPIDTDLLNSDKGNDMIFLLIPSPFEKMNGDTLNTLAKNDIPITIEASSRILIK